MAECEPAIWLGCRNKDRCNLAALGMPSMKGVGEQALLQEKKSFCSGLGLAIWSLLVSCDVFSSKDILSSGLHSYWAFQPKLNKIIIM